MDTFDDNYGVIHYNCDGKHHSRECQQVNTEADQLQYEESSNPYESI